MNEVEADRELSLALCYFLMRYRLALKDWSIEMLFSNGYENDWSLNEENWEKLIPALPTEVEDLN